MTKARHIISGRILTFDDAPLSSPEAQAARLTHGCVLVEDGLIAAVGDRASIALAAPERSQAFPDIPTFRELGHDIVVENWTGLSGPAGMDPAMVETINDTVAEIMQLEAVVERLAQFGVEHTPMTAEQFTGFVEGTITTWEPLIKAAKVNG